MRCSTNLNNSDNCKRSRVLKRALLSSSAKEMDSNKEMSEPNNELLQQISDFDENNLLGAKQFKIYSTDKIKNESDSNSVDLSKQDEHYSVDLSKQDEHYSVDLSKQDEHDSVDLSKQDEHDSVDLSKQDEQGSVDLSKQDEKFSVIEDTCSNEENINEESLVFKNIKLITGAWNEFSHNKKYDEVYLKGCKWSPDGTCLLTSSNDSIMRLFDLPLSLYNCHKLSDNIDFPELKPSLKSKVGGLVYDYSWYPLMNSTDPATCCFVTTSFCSPIHLWDAFSGSLRCSYKGYNALDELHAALSVVFNPAGDLLLSGYKDSIKIFHTNVPGRDFTNISTKDLCEQKGIVSCIAVNPSMPNIFAAGTYTKTVGLYSLDGHALCLMTGQAGGLTQLLFSQDGSQLFAAGRKDPEILCWDLRYLGQILCVMKRPHTTNQRIYMDLSSDGRYLLSGSSSGEVYTWDLQAVPPSSTGSETTVIEHLTHWRAHNDCVNGLSVHRHIPVIATASGQRYIPEISEDDEKDLFVTERPLGTFEDSIKLWWAGNI